MIQKLREKYKIADYIIIILGSFIIGYAIKNIYDPARLVTGGVSGIAVIFNALFEVPLWLTNTIMNIPLFIITYKIKGWRFMVKTFISTMMLSVALLLIPYRPLVRDFDPLLSAIFGGIITGIGTGMVFMCSATTGGTDMLAADIQHFMRHRTVAQVLMVLDGLVVIVGAGIFGINTALYAVISVYLVTKVSDGIVEGIKFGKIVYIISDKPEEIAKEIMDRLGRGITGIDSVGMYTGNKRTMLYCVVTSREIPIIKDIIYNIDTSAFVTVSDANEVMGEGFQENINK
ncbi:MAG: YitT family protein [Eubacteriales bacterium]|nr:YitT family protein [Eubacteriales bacterium]